MAPPMGKPTPKTIPFRRKRGSNAFVRSTPERIEYVSGTERGCRKEVAVFSCVLYFYFDRRGLALC